MCWELLVLLLLLCPGTRSRVPAAPTPPAPITHPTHEEREEPPRPGEGVTGDPSPTPPTSVPPPPAQEVPSRDIIPLYCSLLAALVLGLLAYVAFKCWHTCRQQEQLSKARAGDTLGTSPGVPPHGEKLQGDSGDTPRPQEHPQPGKAPRPQGPPCSSGSPEELLERGDPGGDLSTPLALGPGATRETLVATRSHHHLARSLGTSEEVTSVV